MKKKIVLFVVALLIIMAIAIAVLVKQKLERTYILGDYGVEITVPVTYIDRKKSNKGQLLNLYNTKDKIVISSTELRGDFWSSDDIEDIVEEYLKLISNAYFDSSINDLSKNYFKIGEDTVGQIRLNLAKPEIDGVQEKLQLYVVLLPKSHGYLAIEIYGDEEKMVDNRISINSIIKSITFTKNTHDYSKDIKSQLTIEEVEEQTAEFFKNLTKTISGDSLSN